MSNHNFSAAILAGGKSRRMGFNKEDIQINGKNLTSSIIEQLHVHFNEVIVVSNSGKVYDGVEVVTDEFKNVGPLGGIHVALKNSSTDFVYITACDMPFFSDEYISVITDIVSKQVFDIYVYKCGEFIEPMNAVYSKKCIKNLECFLESGKRSVHEFIESVSVRYITEDEIKRIENYNRIFENLNSKEDLDGYSR